MRLLLFTIVFILATIAKISLQEPLPVKRIVLDVDVGADDAFALLVLLHAEKIGRVKIEAIVCSYGNSDRENTCKNVVRLLEVVKRTDIPVYKGISKAIVPLPDDFPGLNFFGKDGFGDLKYDNEPDISIIKDEPAVNAIHKLVSSNPKEIILVCVGPLTNTAIALLMYDDFASQLKEIWVMGGNYKGNGNTTKYAEFNFLADAESANIVLQNGHCPIMLFTWEICLSVNTSMDWRFNVLGKIDSPFMDLLNRVERKVYQNVTLDHNWSQCDAYTAINVVYPETILKTVDEVGSVELRNETTRGRVLYHKLNQNKINVIIIKEVDDNAVKKIFLEAAKNV